MKKISSAWLPWLVVVVLLMQPVDKAWGQAPGWAWATLPGGGHGAAITLDAAGNVYLTGGFTGTATFGTTTLTSAGGQDVFVAQYSSAGICHWAVRAGGSGDEYGTDLKVDATGSVYVIGDFKGNTTTFGATTLTNSSTSNYNEIFVAKLEAAQTWRWAVKAGGTNSDLGRALALDGSGNVLVTGSVEWPAARFGSLTVGVPVTMDVFVAKLDPAGNWQWVTSGGGPEMDLAYGLAVDSGGNTFVAGLSRSPTATFGAQTLTSHGVGDAYVAKLDPAGGWQWVVGAGTSGEDGAQRLALDAAGNIYVAGYLDSTTATFGSLTLAGHRGGAGFVGKLTAAGTWQWATATTGPGSAVCIGLALDAAGAVYVSGAFTDSTTFGPTTLSNSGPATTFDLFVAQLTSGGGWQGAASAGGAGGSEFGVGLAVTATGTAFVSGGTSSPTVSFGATTLANAGAPAGGCFLARLSSFAVGLVTDISSPTFTLAPNPAHETVRLTGTAASTTATLLDGLGRTVRTLETPTGTTTLDLRGLAPGVYTVRAGAATRRLVIE